MKNYFQKGITKPRAQLHPAPSTSTQLHPPPISSFQPPPSSLQHPQHYLNENITHNWAISLNLGRKIQSRPFCLKLGSQGMLEVVNLNPDLDFWNSDPKIHFWPNLGSKSQSCPFRLKIGTHSIFWKLIIILILVFWIPKSKFNFGQN